MLKNSKWENNFMFKRKYWERNLGRNEGFLVSILYTQERSNEDCVDEFPLYPDKFGIYHIAV